MRVWVIFWIFLIVACQPRGEFKTVQEVFELSKTRFESALKNSDNGHVEALKGISDLVEFVTTNGYSEDLRILGIKLGELLPYVNPTVRPSLNEQADTCLRLSELSNVSREELLLLGSRIFNILSSELETTSFKYSYQ